MVKHGDVEREANFLLIEQEAFVLSGDFLGPNGVRFPRLSWDDGGGTSCERGRGWRWQEQEIPAVLQLLNPRHYLKLAGKQPLISPVLCPLIFYFFSLADILPFIRAHLTLVFISSRVIVSSCFLALVSVSAGDRPSEAVPSAFR